jgi:UDP-N-acetylglucosamine--dolichyl-phosphate N-acetylglucosaminephosphotransferase
LIDTSKMDISYALLGCFVTSFIFVFAATPVAISRLKSRGITGKDGHKPNKPEVPEMGGVSILLGYSVAVILCASVLIGSNLGVNPTLVVAALGAFLIAGAVGVIDDLYKLSHRVKPVLLLLAALPIILLNASKPEVTLPFLTIDFTNVGGYDVSPLFWLMIVPLGITGAGNVVNMLAGFNGLMSGLGVISCSALALISLVLGRLEAAFIFTGMAGAQMAFLHFNKYPAKVFPGDVGTLSLGALIAAGLIIGKIEFIGVLVLLPHIVNASMSLLSVGGFFEEKQFRKEKMSALQISPEGLISFTKLEKPLTLCKLLLYRQPQSESTLVLKVCALSLISSSVAIIYTLM